MTERQATYSPIADYGVIGNCHTAALGSSQGAINWLCLPRFDSPSLFARVLDLKSDRCNCSRADHVAARGGRRGRARVGGSGRAVQIRRCRRTPHQECAQGGGRGRRMLADG